MKSKLKLAIISIILHFVLEYWLLNSYYYEDDEIYFWIQKGLKIIFCLSILGVLPFLISLYNSRLFSKFVEEEEKQYITKSQLSIGYPIKRVILILIVNALPFAILLSGERGMGVGYSIIYGLIITFSSSFLFILIEAIILYRKKKWDKFYWNIILITIMIMILKSISEIR